MMDAMKCFINQRDISDQMKSNFLLLPLSSLSLSQSIFLPEGKRGRLRREKEKKQQRERREGDGER
jgi:hypothetical protein